ncbi:alpha-amylase, partial [Mycena amicta]
GSNIYRRAPSQSNNVVVQLFEWPWDSIAQECVSYLGPNGYGFVQVSPPNEHSSSITGWTDYQPVSYTIISKRGSRDQFARMVSTCKAAGVGIIADVVLNHMTSGSGRGIGGSTYTKYNYPAAGYSSSNFHYCNNGQAADISNYKDAHNVQFCELSGLADLAQEQPAVQNIIAAYLNDLLSMGVFGFRIDAAKHMVDADIKTILSKLSYAFYDTQEVIYGAGEAVQPSQYVTSGSVFVQSSTRQIVNQQLVKSSNFVQPMGSSSPWGFTDSSVATYIMANQDTERGGTSLNSKSPNNVYILSAIFMLAFNYWEAHGVSSYDYSSFDAGAPQNPTTGITNPVTCGASGWRCEHRNIAIANMVAFHNTVGSVNAPLTNIAKGTSNQIAFGRGNLGFVVINNDNTVWSKVWSTSLPGGVYCDIIHDTNAAPDICNGPSYTVSDSGTFSASVAPRDALALVASSVNANANGTSSTTSTLPPSSTGAVILFKETVSTASGETVKIVGSIPQLGNWAPASAIALTSAGNSVWSVSVVLPPNTQFQYKFIRVNSGSTVQWESDPNRSYTTLSAGSSVTVSSSWK